MSQTMLDLRLTLPGRAQPSAHNRRFREQPDHIHWQIVMRHHLAQRPDLARLVCVAAGATGELPAAAFVDHGLIATRA